MTRRAGVLARLLAMLGWDERWDAARPAADSSDRTGADPPRLPTYGEDRYELDDGEQMHAAAPETFHIPDAARRRNLAPGDTVMLRPRTRSGTESEPEWWKRCSSTVSQAQHLQYLRGSDRVEPDWRGADRKANR